MRIFYLVAMFFVLSNVVHAEDPVPERLNPAEAVTEENEIDPNVLAPPSVSDCRKQAQVACRTEGGLRSVTYKWSKVTKPNGDVVEEASCNWRCAGRNNNHRRSSAPQPVYQSKTIITRTENGFESVSSSTILEDYEEDLFTDADMRTAVEFEILEDGTVIETQTRQCFGEACETLLQEKKIAEAVNDN